jgi:nucleotide-binding universal stress UspA family protein
MIGRSLATESPQFCEEKRMKAFAPKRILAATDLSDLSIWALRHAGAWAQRFGSQVVVLHVQEPLPVSDELHSNDYVAQLIDSCREMAQAQLAQSVLLHLPDSVRTTQELRMGSPAEVIEACARSEGADLVVLGTHGRSGLSRLVMGSVAERTLHLARHPTLIVHPPSGPAQPETPSVRHILCPINTSDVARFAFEHASAVAQQFGARLTALFVVEEQQADAESLRSAEERLRAWLCADAGADCDFQPVVRIGDAAAEVILLARQTAADLIVIGAQHRPLADTTVLGVTTERVTRHARCPVLVVPLPHAG